MRWETGEVREEEKGGEERGEIDERNGEKMRGGRGGSGR